MRKILIISLMLYGFAGCSSESSTPAGNTSTPTTPDTTSTATPIPVTNATLNGTWVGVCFDDGGSSWVKLSFELDNGNATAKLTTYDDATCATVAMIEILATATYTLGADVTLDGSVAGITTATEFDSTQITGVSPGQKSYDIYAILGDKLYQGDSSLPNDGTSPATRPTSLNGDVDEIFTKQ